MSLAQHSLACFNTMLRKSQMDTKQFDDRLISDEIMMTIWWWPSEFQNPRRSSNLRTKSQILSKNRKRKWWPSDLRRSSHLPSLPISFIGDCVDKITEGLGRCMNHDLREYGLLLHQSREIYHHNKSPYTLTSWFMHLTSPSAILSTWSPIKIIR